jgi:hypothetical protein
MFIQPGQTRSQLADRAAGPMASFVQYMGVGGRRCGKGPCVWPGRHRPAVGTQGHPEPCRRKTGFGNGFMRRGRRVEPLRFHGFPFETARLGHSAPRAFKIQVVWRDREIPVYVRYP